MINKLRQSYFLLLFTSLFLVSCGQEDNKAEQLNESVKDSTSRTSVDNEQSNNQVKVLGADVSHFQGNIDWKEVKKDGVFWAYSKATGGITYTDSLFAQNRKEAVNAGVAFGAYHFYYSNDAPEDQVDNFINHVKEINKGELPPVLDLEAGGIKGEVDIKQYQKEVLTWLTLVEEKLDVQPIIYTNYTFGNAYLNDSSFAKYQLWIADYNLEDAPEIPLAWSSASKTWLMWQKSEKGSFKGISSTNVDHDVFNGSLDELKLLIKK